MPHDFKELNQYTGLFTGFCALFTFFAVVTLGHILKAVQRLHEDYQKVNAMAYREEIDRLTI